MVSGKGTVLRYTEVWKATGLKKLGTTEGFIIPAVKKHMVGALRESARKEGGGLGAFDCLVACRGTSRFLSGDLLAGGVYKV